MVVVKELKSVEDFHEFKTEKDGKLRVVKLMAPWCNPCKVLSETIKGLDSDRIGNTLFSEVDIDTDETEQIGEECHVRGVPVLLFYRDGEYLDRINGNVPASDIYNMIDKLAK